MSSSSRESSTAPLPYGNNGNAVQDVLVFIQDTNFETLKQKGKLSIWFEQLSWMLLLQSHSRVPDFDALKRGNNNSSNIQDNNNYERSSSSSVPLVRFSVVTSPESTSVEAAKALQSDLTQHFFNDDAQRHLVDITSSITCHRSLTTFTPDLKKKKITLADISAPSSVATSRAHSPSSNFFVKIKSVGRNPDYSNEDLECAKERLIDFFVNLVGEMNPMKVCRSPGSCIFSRNQAQQQQQQQQQQNNIKKFVVSTSAKSGPRHSDSDSSDDENDDASFRLDDDDDDDDDRQDDEKQNDDDDDDEETKTSKLALASRQVIFIVCNEFVYHVFSDRCNVNPYKNNEAMRQNQGCFMWARSRMQQQWYSPELWRQNIICSGSLATSSNVSPRLLPAEVTPPPSSATHSSSSTTSTLQQITNHSNKTVVADMNQNNAKFNTSTMFMMEGDVSIAFTEEPNPSLPRLDRQQQQLQQQQERQEVEISIKSPSKQYEETSSRERKNIKSPSADKEFNLDDDDEEEEHNDIDEDSSSSTHNRINVTSVSVDRDFTLDNDEENKKLLVVLPAAVVPKDSNQFVSDDRRSVVIVVDASPAKNNTNDHSDSLDQQQNESSGIILVPEPNGITSPNQAYLERKKQHQREFFERDSRKAPVTPIHTSNNKATSSSNASSRQGTPTPRAAVAGNHELKNVTSAATTNNKSNVLCPSSSRRSSVVSNNNNNNSNNNNNNGTSSRNSSRSRATTPIVRRPSPRPTAPQENQKQHQQKQQRSSFNNGGVQYQARTGEKACSQLYKMGTAALRRKQELEKIEQDRRREQEEEELRKIKAHHPTLSIYNVDSSDVKKLRPKIIQALRADPFSEEGLMLVPNIPEKIPSSRVKNMMARLVPPGPKISKRLENAQQSDASSRPSSRNPTPFNNKTPSSRCSTPPPAWRGAGVAVVAASPLARRSNNTPLRDGIVNENNKSNTARTRSNSPSVMARLYMNRNSAKEAAQVQTERLDSREVEDLIESRKKDNPSWNKMVAKDPSIEEAYRKRLLRSRQEERRLNEQRVSAMNRNPDPRYPPSSVADLLSHKHIAI